MHREFEIKLEIPAAAASKVMRLPWLWALASGEMRPQRIVSTYFDTNKFALRARGISLRVRTIGEKRLQTLKAAAAGAALPLERCEWEEEIAGEVPQLNLASGAPLKSSLRKKLQSRLRPVFEVRVDRSAFPIQSANSTIEVAIDRAAIAAGEATDSFCEVELELKRGAASELARVARRIVSEIPATLVLASKSDRGFALRGAPGADPQDPIELDPAIRVGGALQTIGWACLRQFVLSAPAVLNDAPTGVHQMRVGLRRLRAAISVFKHLVDGPETDAVKAELKWLTDELGPARDLDVFLDETLAPMLKAHPEQTGLSALRADTIARRAEAMKRAQLALNGDRYRQLALRTAFWLLAAEWSDTSDLSQAHPSRRLRPFAARVLGERRAHVLRRLEQLGALNEPDRHTLRLSVKNLRYAAEFFAGAFPDKKRVQRQFTRALENIQNDLGRLNDLAVHERLRDEFMRDWTKAEATDQSNTAEKAFAMGFVLGRQQHEKAAHLSAIADEAKRLAHLSPFWA